MDWAGEKEPARAAATERKEMVRDPQILALIHSLADWPGSPIKNHKPADPFCVDCYSFGIDLLRERI
jgi:hypothetical protein